MNSYQRDGFMCFDANGKGGPNYYPNSFGGPEPHPPASEPSFQVSGMAARQDYTHPNDDFVQAGDLYKKVMTGSDRDHLISNIVGHLVEAQKRIQLRQCAVFCKAGADYGLCVAEGLKLDVKEVENLASVSQWKGLRPLPQMLYLL